jgi:hypothetical protein
MTTLNGLVGIDFNLAVIVASTILSSQRAILIHQFLGRASRRSRLLVPRVVCQTGLPLGWSHLSRFSRRFFSGCTTDPVFLPYCLGSSQIVQEAGGWSLSAYCVPQVVRMRWGMLSAF